MRIQIHQLTALLAVASAALMPHSPLIAQAVKYFPANPRVHIAADDGGGEESWGLVNNFPKIGPTQVDTIEVASGTTVAYLTGPQNGELEKGCEGVWYPGGWGTIVFQYELWDAAADSLITTDSQIWTHTGSSRAKMSCEQNGQIKIQETYSGNVNDTFPREIVATSLVIRKRSGTEIDTTASTTDVINTLIKIVP
jgi:hypothetical protein